MGYEKKGNNDLGYYERFVRSRDVFKDQGGGIKEENMLALDLILFINYQYNKSYTISFTSTVSRILVTYSLYQSLVLERNNFSQLR